MFKLVFATAAVTAALAAPAAFAGAQPHLFDPLLRDLGLLPAAQAQPFVAKLDAAAVAFERGNACASRNVLGAFGNQFDAKLRNGAIDERVGAALAGDLDAIAREYPPGSC